MNRSTALLTVLLAFAIFAIPTSAAPPNPYPIPVEVVNQESEPVVVRHVNNEACERKMIHSRVYERLVPGINLIEICNKFDPDSYHIVTVMASVNLVVNAADRIVQCLIGYINQGTFEMLFALPAVAMNRAQAPTDEMSWTGTLMVNARWPPDMHGCHLMVVFEPNSPDPTRQAMVECTLSGYYVDSACPNP